MQLNGRRWEECQDRSRNGDHERDTWIRFDVARLQQVTPGHDVDNKGVTGLGASVAHACRVRCAVSSGCGEHREVLPPDLPDHETWSQSSACASLVRHRYPIRGIRGELERLSSPWVSFTVLFTTACPHLLMTVTRSGFGARLPDIDLRSLANMGGFGINRLIQVAMTRD